MKMELDVFSLKENQLILNITHAGKSIAWNISPFDKRVFAGNILATSVKVNLDSVNTDDEDEDENKPVTSYHDIFKHINQYWAYLPAWKQEKIFEIYAQIRNVLEEVYDTTILIGELIPLIHNLFEEHKLDEIGHWMGFHSDVILPHKLDDVYKIDDSKPGSREKTYLKSDYIDLINMTVSLRIMIPIWGEFIYRTKKDTGTQFKEFYSYKLLAQTHLSDCAPMEKLRVYVQSNIQSDKPMMSSIINGIGSEDFPTWLLSKVLVMRLCVGDISGSNISSSLVTFIWNFITQKVNGTNAGSYSSMVKPKEFESGDQSSDHNTSRLEGYKMKTELPIGDIVILEQYMDDPINVALQLRPSIDLELLNKFLLHAKALENERIWEPQVGIAQYVLKPVISPRGIPHLSKKQVINAIAIAQTVLWETNHKLLACLISAVATSNNNELMLSGIVSNARIPKEIMDELSVLFPFSKVSASKKKGKVANSAVVSIDELAQMFSQRDWILTVPTECILEIMGKDIRRFSCPHDIKILLAKLIIQLANNR